MIHRIAFLLFFAFLLLGTTTANAQFANTEAQSAANDLTKTWEAFEDAYLAEDWETVARLSAELPSDQQIRIAQAWYAEHKSDLQPAIQPQAELALADEKQLALDTAAEDARQTARAADVRANVHGQPDPVEATIPAGNVPDPQRVAAILTVGTGCTYGNIQAAINAASSGDTIRVATQTWTGSTAKINVNSKSLTISGGYNSNCTIKTNNRTVLNASGVPGSVAQIYGTLASTVSLEDFELRGGTSDFNYGGGLEISGNHTVTLDNVHIVENSSTFGGGIHMSDGVLTLTGGTKVSNNTATNDGGGIFCFNGTLNVEGNANIGLFLIFDAEPNIANSNDNNDGNGGGIYADDCTVNLGATGFATVQTNQAYHGGGIYAINNSRINLHSFGAGVALNTATQLGGGLYLGSGADVYVDDGLVGNNSAGASGGGIYATGANTIADFDSNNACNPDTCARLSFNTATVYGGGAYVAAGAELDLESTYAINNESGSLGNAIYALNNNTLVELDSVMLTEGKNSNNYVVRLLNTASGAPTATLTNVTIAGVTGLTSSDAIFGLGDGSQLTLSASIVYANSTDNLVDGTGTATISCSILSEPFAGSGNEVIDPLFLDPANSNYNISRNSPAVDKCASGFVYDVDRENRPNNIYLVGDDGVDYDAGADEVYAQVGINGSLCSYSTIVDAIAAASDGDTIYIPIGGQYDEMLGDINKSLTFVSATDDCTTELVPVEVFGARIDANNSPRLFGGVARIMTDTTVTFRNIILEDGTADFGGILYVNEGALVTLDDSHVWAGSASNLGGGLRVLGTVELINNSFLYDHVTTDGGHGGGIAIGSTGTVNIREGSRIGLNNESSRPNQSDGNGGGIYMLGGELNVYDNSTLRNNHAFAYGGGLYADGGATIHFFDTAMIGGPTLALSNTASFGGGAFLTGSGTRLTLEPDTTVQNNHSYADGGGFFVQTSATLIVDGADILDNATLPDPLRDGYGGGIVAGGAGATLDIQNGARIVGNSADFGGGIYTCSNTSEINIANSNIENNNASLSGGGMYINECPHTGAFTTVYLTDTTINNNSAGVAGGGIYLERGILNAADTDMQFNSAADAGGGIYNFEGNMTLTALNSVSNISANHADLGGGIYDESGSTLSISAISNLFNINDNGATTDGGGIYISNGTHFRPQGQFQMSGNVADRNGGAIYADNATAFVDDSFTHRPVIWGNSATTQHGGGIYVVNSSDFTLNGVDLGMADGGNFANRSGGGLYAMDSNITLDTTIVEDNTAEGFHGGGLALIDSTLTVDNSFAAPTRAGIATACDPQTLPANVYCSEFRDNFSGRDGGAIYAENSTIDIEYVALLDNLSFRSGSAIYMEGTSSGSVRSSLFADNNSIEPTNATVYVYIGSVLDMMQNTLVDNFDAGVVYAGGSAGNFDGNIAWDNSADSTIIDASPTCNNTQLLLAGGSGNISSDPLFVTTARGDYHLALNSPAIDACSSGPAVDLDNVARPIGAAYDMGAFEHDPNTIPTAIELQVLETIPTDSMRLLVPLVTLLLLFTTITRRIYG